MNVASLLAASRRNDGPQTCAASRPHHAGQRDKRVEPDVGAWITPMKSARSPRTTGRTNSCIRLTSNKLFILRVYCRHWPPRPGDHPTNRPW